MRYRPIVQALERRDLPSGFGSLVQVSGLSPWQNTSDTTGQPGTFYLNSEVEPSLAVDPNNPAHLIGVWQQDRWSNGGSRGIVSGASMDGGNTWTSVPLPGVTVNTGGTFLRASDPWVTIAPNGDVYVASLVAQPGIGLGVYVNKSTTGGLTWSNPSVIIDDSHNIDGSGNYEFFDDKESITADPTNPNNVYVVWDRINLVTGTSAPAMFSRTTDGGQTWSAPQSIFDPSNGTTLGNQIVVLPNGILVNVTTVQDNTTNAIEIVALRSMDHGSTWSAPINVSSDTAIIATDPNNPSKGVRTGEQLPAVAVDHRSGNIYIAWEDTSFSSGAIDQIAFTMSTDGGLDWTAPAKINQTPTGVPTLDQQAFTPSVAVAASGEVAVSYYDFRNNTGAGGLATDAWVVFANPAASLTFGHEQRLTPTSFNIELAPYAGWGYFVGDYEGLVAGGISFNTFGAFFGIANSATDPTNIVFRGIVPPSTYGQPIYLSGLTPWANTSDIPGQTGTNALNSAVEPNIAADPRNPLHLVAVWQQDRWSDGGSRGIMAAVTTDGGASWTDVAIPGVSAPTGGPLPRASDPWVSIAPNGDIYVSVLSAVSVNGPDETINISKSTDGGYTWGAPTALISDTDPHFFDDKETVTADPTNSNYVYVTWDRLTFDPNTFAFVDGPAMLARSTNGGQTWTNSVIFAGGTNTQTLGNQIVVLPNGNLLDVFDYFDFNANTATFEVIRSTDHGVSWSAPVAVAADDSIGVSDPNTAAGVRAGGSIPGIAVNRTTGAVYIVWEDGRFSGFTHEGIAISQSTDGGSTWSMPVQVNQTPTGILSSDQQAFTPQVAVAANGVIAVTYYDFRNNTGGPGLATDYWVAFANPGSSLTFGNEQRLTPGSFNGELAPNAFGLMIGDYMGLVAGGVSFNTFASAFEVTVSPQNPSRIVFENVSAPDTFVVTNTTDDLSNPAQGSLRWAINQANSHPGPDYIYFDIGPGGAQTITPVAGLPAITDSVTIDATTQPGFAGQPLIQINGALAGSVNGLVIGVANCVVKGLDINGFALAGIALTTSGATNNHIEGNYLGTDLSGASAVPNVWGVAIENGAHNNIIGSDGLAGASERNVLSGNSASGVIIIGGGSNQNIVAGNYIGTDVTGMVSVPNGTGGGGAGVLILAGAQQNIIGTNGDGIGDALEGNLISGNAHQGIDIRGDGTDSNVIAGNIIGLAADGTTPLGNSTAGLGQGSNIRIFTGPQFTRIGTNGDGVSDGLERNIISASGTLGINIIDSSFNVVAGNYIGTDITGTIARGNAYAGVQILSLTRVSQFNRIGVSIFDSDPLAEGNLIAGNGFVGMTNDIALNQFTPGGYDGVFVVSTSTSFLSTNTLIAGNTIGTNLSVDAGLGNAESGIYVLGASATVIESGNVISGNARSGITIDGATSTTSTAVLANYIGTDPSGTVVRPNAGAGVQIINGATNTAIGEPGFGNVIAFNGGAGVVVLGQTTVDNQIRANAIYANGALGIDLGGDGVTLNHIGTEAGPNNFQNYPVITVARHGPTTRVLGYFNSVANTTFTLDFYASTFADPSGFGQGQRYLGSGQVSTDASGNANFDSATFINPLGASLSTEFITVAATDPAGNTSEFSAAVLANSGPTAVNDSYLLQENSSNVLAVLANDKDPAGDPLSIIAVGLPGHGTATISGNAILYTPTAGYFGPDNFTYTISDGFGDTSTATVNISVNGLPVAQNYAYTVQQNSVNNSLAINDSDPDGDPVTLTSVGTPVHGTATISGSNILYTPTAGFFGSDSFTYTVSDGQGGTSVGLVSITVPFHPVMISGTVFADLNDNHIQDAGEAGLAGWTVQLDGGAMSVTTDASGQYTFTGAGPGTHTVSEVVQSAYIETSPRGNTFTINTSNGLDVSGKNFSNEIPTNARDNSLNGYSEHGAGWTTVNKGWLGTSRVHAADPSGNSYASWQMNIGAPAGIPAGKYEVFVSYVPGGGLATIAPYTIIDNKTILATIAINQTLIPNDGLYQGVRWRSLGVFTFNSGKPIVVLSAKASGPVDADGVLLIPASSYAPPMSPLNTAAATLAQLAPVPKVQGSLGSFEAASRDTFFSFAGLAPSLEGFWLGAAPAAAGQVDALIAERSRPQMDDLDSALFSLLMDAGNA
jgi:hypothetical protein